MQRLINPHLIEVEALLEEYRHTPTLKVRNQIMLLLYPWLKRKIWWLLSSIYWKQAVPDQDVQDILHDVCIASMRLIDRQSSDCMTSLQYLLGGCKWTIRNILYYRFSGKSAVEISGLTPATANYLLLKAGVCAPSPTIEDESIQEAKEIRVTIENAIAHLCKGQESVAYLRIINGLSIQSCAVELGLSFDTARNRIFRARQTLRQSLLRNERIRAYAQLPGVKEQAIKLHGMGLPRKIIRKRLGRSYKGYLR